MARKKVFDLDTREGRSLLDKAYQRYMEPNWTVMNTAMYFEVSPTTLTNAFHEMGLPLKVNHKVSAAAVLKEQKMLRCPVDYLAAKYGVAQQTINKWSREHRHRLVDTRRAPAQRWWDTFFNRFNDPNAAVWALTQKPHGIPLHAIPALYHKRVRPDVPVIWQLDSDEPYGEIELDTFQTYMGELTEPCHDFAPQLWLGYQDVCNPVQWIEEPVTDTFDPEEELLADDESDLDLESLAEELGIEL